MIALDRRLARIVGVAAVERQLRIALSPAAILDLGVPLGGRVDSAWADDMRTLALWPGGRHKIFSEGGRMLILQVVLPPALRGVVMPRLQTSFAPRVGGGIVIDVPEDILAWEDDDPDVEQAPALPAHIRFPDDPRACAECAYDTRGCFA